MSEPLPNALQQTAKPVLALDAMGVLYAAGDDVAELLVPFVTKNASGVSSRVIEREYLAASLGEIDAAAFWRRVGVDPALEDAYLSGHRLNEGVVELLASAPRRFCLVCSLSNDVSQWSLKLRRSFGLERSIDLWVISSDVGSRKPSPEIYRHLLHCLQVSPERVVFVDDRAKNLDGAKQLGIRTILFDPRRQALPGPHPRIERLLDLLSLDC